MSPAPSHPSGPAPAAAPQRLTTAEYWDAEWERLPTPRQLSPGHPYYGRNGLFMRMLRRRAALRPGMRVLELGGGGPNYRLLALHQWLGAEVTAIDFSAAALARLRQVFELNGGQVRVVTGDFLLHDFGEERFDLVTHWGVLEHFDPPVAVLRRSAELLAPGGQVVFSMPNLAGLSSVLWRRWSPENWSHHVYHDVEEVREAAAAAGLRLTQHFHYGFPCVKIADWERRGVLPSLASGVQMLLTASAVALPVFHRWGGRAVSMERGFVAVPAAGGR